MQFTRLKGKIDLRMLPNVDMIDVQYGDVRCIQLENHRTNVQLNYGNAEIDCVRKLNKPFYLFHRQCIVFFIA